MTQPQIEWGELPPDATGPKAGPRGRASSLQAQAQALKTRPHAWAKIVTRADAKKARATASQIMSGKLAPFADAKYEAAVSGNDVWARYLGPA